MLAQTDKKSQNGVANVLGIIGLAILILVIPLTVKLVEQRQEVRKLAYPGQECTTKANCNGLYEQCINGRCVDQGAPAQGFCGDNSCNNGETCSSCPGDCGNCPATPTSPPALPGDAANWKCPGPNCDKCGYAGWEGSGCKDFCSAHPNDGSCSQINVPGPLTACGSFANQCSAGSGPVRDCNGNNKIVIRDCGNDGCYHDVATSEDCVPLVQVPAPTTQEQQQLQQAIQTEAEKRCQEQFGLSQTSSVWQNCLDGQKTEIIKEMTVEETRFNSQTAIAQNICQKQGADRNERMWDNCLNRFVVVINDGFNLDPVTGHKYLPPEAVQASNCRGVTVFSNDPVNYYDCGTGQLKPIDAPTRTLCESKQGLIDYDACQNYVTETKSRCQAEINRGEKEGETCLGVQAQIIKTEIETEQTRQETELGKRGDFCQASGGATQGIAACLADSAKQISKGYSLETDTAGKVTGSFYLVPDNVKKLTECTSGSLVAQDDFNNWYSCFGGIKITQEEAAKKLGVTELPSATVNQQMADSIIKPDGQFYAEFVKAVTDKDKGATTFWVKDEQGNEVPVTIQIGFGQAGADGYLIAMGGRFIADGKISDIQTDFDQAQKKASEIKITTFDPSVLSFLNEGALQRTGLAQGLVIPEYKPYDPTDTDMVKKYGNESDKHVVCEVSFGEMAYSQQADEACTPEKLYLQDTYAHVSGGGVSVATNIDSAKRAYDDTSALCGVLADKWNENCQEMFLAKFGGDLVSNQNAVKHAVVMVGTSGLPLIPAILGPLHVSPAAPVTFTLDALSFLGSTMAFSAKEEDQRYAAKVLLEDKFGKGITAVNDIGNYSAYDLAQKAKLDTSALGDKSILDNRYLIYTMAVTGFNYSGVYGQKPKPVVQMTDPAEQQDFLNKINGSLPSNAKFKDWGELVQFSMLREGLLDYQNKALQTGSGMVFQEKEAEYRQVLVTNTVFGLAAVGGMSVVGKGIGKAVDMFVTNRAAQTLEREVAVSRWTNLLAAAGRDEEGAVARALGQEGTAKIILTDGKTIAAQAVKDNFQQYSTKIAGILFKEDHQLAVQAVNEAAKGAGLLERINSGSLAKKVDLEKLKVGEVVLTPEVVAARLAKAPAPAAPAQPAVAPAAPEAAPKVVPPAKYGLPDRLPIVGGEPGRIESKVVDDLLSGKVAVPEDQLDDAIVGLLEGRGYRPGSLADGVKNVRNSLKQAQEKVVAEAQQAAELAAAPVAPAAPAPAGVPQAVVETINNLPAPLRRPARGWVIDLPEAIGGVTQQAGKTAGNLSDQYLAWSENFNKSPLSQRIVNGLSDATDRVRNVFKRAEVQAPTGGAPLTGDVSVNRFGIIQVGKQAEPTQDQAVYGIRNLMDSMDEETKSLAALPSQAADLDLGQSVQKANIPVQGRSAGGWTYYDFVPVPADAEPGVYTSSKIYIDFRDQNALDSFVKGLQSALPGLKASGLAVSSKTEAGELILYIESDVTRTSVSAVDQAIQNIKTLVDLTYFPGNVKAVVRGTAQDPWGIWVRGGVVKNFSPTPSFAASNDSFRSLIVMNNLATEAEKYGVKRYQLTAGRSIDQFLTDLRNLMDTNPQARAALAEKYTQLTQLGFRDITDVTKRGAIPIAVDLNDQASLKMATDLAERIKANGYNVEFIDDLILTDNSGQNYVSGWINTLVPQGHFPALANQQEALQKVAQGMGLEAGKAPAAGPVAERSVVGNFKRIGLGTQSFIQEVSDRYANWADNFNVTTAPRIDQAISDVTDRVRNVFKRAEVQAPTGGAPEASTRAVAYYDQDAAADLVIIRREIDEGAVVNITALDNKGKAIAKSAMMVDTRDKLIDGINGLAYSAKPQKIAVEVINPNGQSFLINLSNKPEGWSKFLATPTPLRVHVGNVAPSVSGIIYRSSEVWGISFIACNLIQPISGTVPCRFLSQRTFGAMDFWAGLFGRSAQNKQMNDDKQFLATLHGPCKPDTTKLLPGRTDYVACDSTGQWQGECIPNSVLSDSKTGIPVICGEDYHYKPLPASSVTQEAVAKFKEAENYRLELNKKYDVNIIASLGYWKKEELTLLDKLFPELPPYFYRGKTIDGFIKAFMGGNASYLYPQYVRVLWTNGLDKTDFSGREFLINTFIHEMLHSIDLTGGLKTEFSESGEFEGLINKYGFHFADKLDSYGNKVLDEELRVKQVLKDKNGLEVSSYDYCGTNFLELFACMGTNYVLQPEKLKNDFPDIYNFYKNRVYEGKDYLGKDLAWTIVKSVFPDAIRPEKSPTLPTKEQTPTVTPTKTPTVPPAGTITPTPQSPTATTIPPQDRVGNNIACYLVGSCPNSNGVPLGFAVAQDNIDKFNKLKLYKNMPDGEYEYTVFEGNIMPGSATVDVKVIVTNGRYAIWIRPHAEPGQVQQNYTIYASGSASDLPTVGSLGPTQLPGLSPGTEKPTQPASVLITQDNVDRLKTFPRPPGDNGRGIHFTLDMKQSTVDSDLQKAKDLGVKWAVLFAGDQEQAVRAATQVWNAGIMPIVRFNIKTNQTGANFQSWLRITSQQLNAKNIPAYIQIYNEPVSQVEWTSGSYPVGNNAEATARRIFAQNWVNMARIVYDNGGYPGLQILDAQQLDAVLTQLPASDPIWQKTWFSMHNYATDGDLSNDPSYVPGSVDEPAFLKFLNWAQIFQDRIGFVPPIIGTEGGWEPKAPQGQSKPSEQEFAKTADYFKQAYDVFRTGVLPDGEPLPDYLFTFSPYILGGYTDYKGFAWYGGIYGDMTDNINAVKSIPNFERKFSWDVPTPTSTTTPTVTKPPTVTPTRTQTPTITKTLPSLGGTGVFQTQETDLRPIENIQKVNLELCKQNSANCSEPFDIWFRMGQLTQADQATFLDDRLSRIMNYCDMQGHCVNNVPIIEIHDQNLGTTGLSGLTPQAVANLSAALGKYVSKLPSGTKPIVILGGREISFVPGQPNYISVDAYSQIMLKAINYCTKDGAWSCNFELSLPATKTDSGRGSIDQAKAMADKLLSNSKISSNVTINSVILHRNSNDELVKDMDYARSIWPTIKRTSVIECCAIETEPQLQSQIESVTKQNNYIKAISDYAKANNISIPYVIINNTIVRKDTVPIINNAGNGQVLDFYKWGSPPSPDKIKVPVGPQSYLEVPKNLWQQVLTAVSGSIISAISVISLLFGGR